MKAYVNGICKEQGQRAAVFGDEISKLTATSQPHETAKLRKTCALGLPEQAAHAVAFDLPLNTLAQKAGGDDVVLHRSKIVDCMPQGLT